jgi:hypothetical protein
VTGLRTRTPTGEVAWPLILVEGDEKAGKSYAAYSLSADERVGRTFVFEFGEGIADEYAQLGPYEIVEHNGTYQDLLAQVKAACAEPTEPGKPNVVVIDQMTELWDLLNAWAEHRARGTKSSKAKLKADPDAEIDITANLHNDKADRWYAVLNRIRRSNVIGVLVCRGKEVTKFRNGQPVAGEIDYSIQGHKGTVFAVKAHVRMTKPHVATLLGVNSLNIDVPANGRRLADSNPLGELVFDILGCGADSVARPLMRGTLGIDRVTAMKRLLELMTREGAADPKTDAGTVWNADRMAGAEEMSPDDLARILDAGAALVAAQREGTPAPEPVPSALDAFDHQVEDTADKAART